MKVYQHKKRGTRYTIIGEASVQVSGEPLRDGDEATVYRIIVSGDLCVRRTTEFHDGRFIFAMQPTLAESLRKAISAQYPRISYVTERDLDAIVDALKNDGWNLKHTPP